MNVLYITLFKFKGVILKVIQNQRGGLMSNKIKYEDKQVYKYINTWLINNINLQEQRKSAVYAITLCGVVLYIGSTKKCLDRISAHWFYLNNHDAVAQDDVTAGQSYLYNVVADLPLDYKRQLRVIPLFMFDDDSDNARSARDHEKYAIQIYKPLFNLERFDCYGRKYKISEPPITTADELLQCLNDLQYREDEWIDVEMLPELVYNDYQMYLNMPEDDMTDAEKCIKTNVSDYLLRIADTKKKRFS